jgi:hypothetical protein
MIEYLSYERKEGDFGLQEVVKDYTKEVFDRDEQYQLQSLKIVRTANTTKFTSFKPLVAVGEDYFHRVNFNVRVKGSGQTYWGSFSKQFPDTQEGLNDAEKYKDHVILEYNKNKIHHPKKWSIFKN